MLNEKDKNHRERIRGNAAQSSSKIIRALIEIGRIESEAAPVFDSLHDEFMFWGYRESEFGKSPTEECLAPVREKFYDGFHLQIENVASSSLTLYTHNKIVIRSRRANYASGHHYHAFRSRSNPSRRRFSLSPRNSMVAAWLR